MKCVAEVGFSPKVEYDSPLAAVVGVQKSLESDSDGLTVKQRKGCSFVRFDLRKIVSELERRGAVTLQLQDDSDNCLGEIAFIWTADRYRKEKERVARSLKQFTVKLKKAGYK